MKRIILVVVLVFFTLATYAQCNQYYQLREGTSWTNTNYDAKGKFEGKTIQKVTNYKESSNGFEATFNVTSVDKKGEQLLAGSSTIICDNGVIYFDMTDMFPDEQMQSIQNFNITVDGTGLELPNNLEEGQELKDAEIIMHVNASPLAMNFKVNVTDRKVLAKEHLNTPAGEYESFKISQKIVMKTLGKIEMTSVEWYAKGVGLVKSESYNKKGKLTSYSLLTAYSY